MEATEHMVPMRDGIRLQTFVYLPDNQRPFAAVLSRCQYGAQKMEFRIQEMLDQGYAVVLQNIRGRSGFEGELTGTSSSGEDGYDTVEWIASQPWNSGSVGTFGRSALARTQVAAAFCAHSAHKAMCPQVLPNGMNSRVDGTITALQVRLTFL